MSLPAGPRRLLACSLVYLASGVVARADAQREPAPDTTLPRRAQLGASLSDVPESLSVRGTARGALVLAVLPASPAAQAGLQPRDVIVRIGADSVNGAAAALRALRGILPGSRVSLSVARDGAARTIDYVARERPRESSPDFDVVYTSVRGAAGRQRVVVAHPRGAGRHPTVMLVGGIGCFSIDQAGGVNGYRDLMYDLTRHGYTTVRLEKVGVGDSEGGPCANTDFETELSGYRTALGAARSYPWVDPSRIFLFGHSIGGIEAPLVASGHDGGPAPRGVAVLSTVGIAWYEYELANLRRQLRLQHLPPDSIERDMSLKTTCGFHLLIDRQSRAALLAAQPECAPFIAYPASDLYLQQVAAHNPAATWRDVASPVLVMYGGADFITSRAEHEELTEAINAMHPGQATFTVIPELDHFLSHQASEQASFADPTPPATRPYDGTRLEPVLLSWLDQVAGVSG